mgnify:CR=1 FL=1
MAEKGRNKPRNRKTTLSKEEQQKKAKEILKILGISALSLLPGGAVIRGGMLVYKGLKGARAIAAAKKAIQAQKAQSSVQTTRTMKNITPKSKQIADKGSVPSGGQVAARKTTEVKKPGTGVQQVRSVGDKKPGMRNITPSQKAVGSKAKTGAGNTLKQALVATGVGVTAGTLGEAVRKRDGKAVAFESKTKEGGPGRDFKKKAKVTGPKSRPKRNAPNFGLGRPDPRGDQIKPTPGDKVAKKAPTMPKKFDGSYNKKEQRLANITIDGKKATYEIPKGMTTKEATSLLKGGAKKKKANRGGLMKTGHSDYRSSGMFY